MAQYSFVGRRVLVSGGANGLGKYIVKGFLETGATVIALDKDVKGLSNLEIECSNLNLITLKVDLIDWEATRGAVEAILPIHHLVNNAGIAPSMEFKNVSESILDEILMVNFKAPFNLCQIFAKGIEKYKIQGGTIINISSVIDRIGTEEYAAYSCSKAALAQLSRNLAIELGRLFQIRSNTIRPDIIKTGIFENICENNPELAKKFIDRFMGRTGLKRMLVPQDLIGLVLFLSSIDSQMINGVDIAIDGGFSIG